MKSTTARRREDETARRTERRQADARSKLKKLDSYRPLYGKCFILSKKSFFLLSVAPFHSFVLENLNSRRDEIRNSVVWTLRGNLHPNSHCPGLIWYSRKCEIVKKSNIYPTYLVGSRLRQDRVEDQMVLTKPSAFPVPAARVRARGAGVERRTRSVPHARDRMTSHIRP